MATLLIWVTLTEKFKKKLLELMRFYHIWHKNSIGHLLRTPRDYFRSHHQSFRKEMNNIIYLLYFYLHFQRVFVEFVALLTKIWHKNIYFYHYS